MDSFWDFFWLLIWTYILVAFLMLLFRIMVDVFRDPHMGGFAKALWVIALVALPGLGALIYLIARGGGMAERQLGAAQQTQAETEQYIQSVASTPNPADQIASAKALLDDGTISEVEYDRVKTKALA
jgi:hypothetical protein